MNTLSEVLNAFTPISLKELNQVSLLQRVDTKYILPANKLPMILSEILDNQLILEIDKQRSFEYLTHYYDTFDFKFYQHHHNGYMNRMKVRTRSYVDSDLNFFEIKHKEFGTRTNKIRKEIDALPDCLSRADYEMIENQRYNGEELDLKMSNSFYRTTLCNKKFTERITFDTDISFFNNKKKNDLPYLSIIEVKQSKADNYSRTIQALKKYQIRPSGFSKYAMGIVLLEDGVKKNNFKSTLLKLNKLANEGYSIPSSASA